MRKASGEVTPTILQGHVAIGPIRSSTAGGSCWENAQPAFKLNAAGGGMAVAHNGNLTNTAAPAGQSILQESPASLPVQPRATSDPDVLAHLVGCREADLSLEGAIVHTMPGLEDPTGTAVLACLGPIRGPCTAWAPGAVQARYRTRRSRRSGRSSPPSRRLLPLPNPEPEVAR